jgi:BMFP domain-containing protein YqiC
VVCYVSIEHQQRLTELQILSAALNKYYSFTQPFAPNWTFWYIREASTAILVANIPQCWPLIRRIFKLRSWNGSSHSNNRTRTNPLTYGRSTVQKPANSIPLGSVPRSVPDNGTTLRDNIQKEPNNISTWFQAGSEEDILQSNKSGRRRSLEIWKTEVFEVQSEMAASTREGSAKSSNSSVTVLEAKREGVNVK